MDQLREVHEDVPCQVGLRSQTKADVGCDVDKLINGVEEWVLGHSSHFEHEAQVQKYTVHFDKQSHHSAGYVVPGENSVQESPDHLQSKYFVEM